MHPMLPFAVHDDGLRRQRARHSQDLLARVANPLFL
jgi:hypothetical protein